MLVAPNQKRRERGEQTCSGRNGSVARQAGRRGRSALGEMLSRANASVTEAVYQRLRLKPRDHVLEIGFGNGKLLPALLAYADDLTYVGLDIATTMVAEAVAFNADLVASGRAAFHLAPVDAIPCADGRFDQAFAINVFYFWPDPVRAPIRDPPCVTACRDQRYRRCHPRNRRGRSLCPRGVWLPHLRWGDAHRAALRGWLWAGCR
jgi:SAM-dependent methyltransferase